MAMKRCICLMLCIWMLLGVIAQEKVKSIGVNGIYLTEGKIWGVEAQMIFPIGKNFHISPDLSYHFPTTNSFFFPQFYNRQSVNTGSYMETTWRGVKVSSKELSYNINILYSFNIGRGRSSISPMIGIGGLTTFLNSDWGDASTIDFTCVANLGLLGRFDLGYGLFMSPQLRYLLPLKSGADNSFQIAAGLGVYF